MRLGYLDCASGASGDMLLAALLGAGWSEAGLRDVVDRLRVPVEIAVTRVERRGVPALRVEVLEPSAPPARALGALGRLLDESALPAPLRGQAREVLARLAAVEAEIHGTPVEQVHLHELGGVDTLVDVVGVLAGFASLRLDRLVASPVNLGRGWVTIRHGTVPVPAPATAALVQGLPVYAGETEGELLTPTGAALLGVLVDGWGALPPLRLERIGTGAGRADPPRANVLRLFVGEALPDARPAEAPRAAGPAAAAAESLVMLETSIDDMNPQLYPYVSDALSAAGALEVMVLPAVMKKGRPGHLLRALAPPSLVAALCDVLTRETTTLGVRVYPVIRHAAGRRVVEVQTEYGPLPVKVASDASGVLTATPEFDACRSAAERHRVPLKRVLDAARRAAASVNAAPGAEGAPGARS
jgi:uncharacterized protein (TIGR00299 family) protein